LSLCRTFIGETRYAGGSVVSDEVAATAASKNRVACTDEVDVAFHVVLRQETSSKSCAQLKMIKEKFRITEKPLFVAVYLVNT
jgi:hypothetical protein